MSKKVLVTGAAGNVASLTIPRLLQGGANVRGLIHTAAKAAPLKQAGAEVVVGDFLQPDTLGPAFQGVDAAFLVAPPGPRAAQQMQHLIDAAKDAGVGHVVRLSALRADSDAPTANGRLHHESDVALAASGLPHTILRPHFYMQNLFMAVPTLREEGKVYMGMGQGKLGLVDVRDVADCAASILLDGGHLGKTYTPTGPASIPFEQVAAAIGKAVGKEVAYVPVPPEAVRDTMLQMGMDAWFGDVMADYSRAYAAGWGDFVTTDVQDLTGHAPRSIEAFAQEVLAPALR